MTSPDPIRAMETYRKTQHEVDRWFQDQQTRRSSQMQCGKSCTKCCHGLFDIGIPDALELTRGIGLLTLEARREAQHRAIALTELVPMDDGSRGEPTLFGSSDDPRIGRMIEDLDEAPCPLLDADGECVVYEHRPMVCRVEGLPVVDVRDGLLGEWCELNFAEGESPRSFDDLAWDWTGVADTEEAAADILAESDADINHSGEVTLVPYLLMVYDTFWKPLLERLGLPDDAGADAQAGGSTTTSS